MKIGKIITCVLGIGLLVWSVFHFIAGLLMWAVVKLIIGGGLIVITFLKNRYGQIIFGHAAIVAGCMLVTAGIYYVPMISESIVSPSGEITLVMIFGMPLFWGFFSIFGGICAIYHGFCRCVRNEGKAK
ncbi:MAG TPA: hypothetical protein PLD62_03925 [Candidatus Cloacimonadota bacterium]|nr:hypothetical protein [Candidatus Cloacimonadota bacterium]